MATTAYYPHASWQSYDDMLSKESGNGSHYQQIIAYTSAAYQTFQSATPIYQPFHHSPTPVQNNYSPTWTPPSTTCQPQPTYKGYSPPRQPTPQSSTPLPTYQPSPSPQPSTPPSYPAPHQQPHSYRSAPIYSHPQYQTICSQLTQQSQTMPPALVKPLTECPCSKGPDGISFATDWYRFQGISEFMICSHCYQDELSAHHLPHTLRYFVMTQIRVERASATSTVNVCVITTKSTPNERYQGVIRICGAESST